MSSSTTAANAALLLRSDVAGHAALSGRMPANRSLGMIFSDALSALIQGWDAGAGRSWIAPVEMMLAIFSGREEEQLAQHVASHPGSAVISYPVSSASAPIARALRTCLLSLGLAQHRPATLAAMTLPVSAAAVGAAFASAEPSVAARRTSKPLQLTGARTSQLSGMLPPGAAATAGRTGAGVPQIAALAAAVDHAETAWLHGGVSSPVSSSATAVPADSGSRVTRSAARSQAGVSPAAPASPVRSRGMPPTPARPLAPSLDFDQPYAAGSPAVRRRTTGRATSIGRGRVTDGGPLHAASFGASAIGINSLSASAFAGARATGRQTSASRSPSRSPTGVFGRRPFRSAAAAAGQGKRSVSPPFHALPAAAAGVGRAGGLAQSSAVARQVGGGARW
jgi:hypothetical protein